MNLTRQQYKEKQDLFEILEISETDACSCGLKALSNLIKQSRNRLAIDNHSDKTETNDDEKMKEINVAKEKLDDFILKISEKSTNQGASYTPFSGNDDFQQSSYTDFSGNGNFTFFSKDGSFTFSSGNSGFNQSSSQSSYKDRVEKGEIITNDYCKIGINNGEVKGNYCKIQTNNGQVTGNYCKIEINNGQVTGNYCKIKTNIGQVTGNHCKIQTNNGQVTGNHCKIDTDNNPSTNHGTSGARSTKRGDGGIWINGVRVNAMPGTSFTFTSHTSHEWHSRS